MERNCVRKDPWEKLGGKMCPSHLSKYPARSHQGACARSLNSLKVPFICSKSGIVFVQGLLFLDKSLALVQAPDCVRMFHRPQQDSTAKAAFPAGPLSYDTASKCTPRGLRSAVHHGQRPCPILISAPAFLEEAPTPTTRQSAAKPPFLRHSIFGFISYHGLFPCGASWQNPFPLPKHLPCI